MFYGDCHITSPICIKSEYNGFIPPIIYAGSLYIIKEKKLHQVLNKIGYFQNYIQCTRNNGYSYTKKWLSLKKLLNEAFLEAVSQCIFDDIDVKTINSLVQFERQDDKPIIDNNYWDFLFKGGILFNYISDIKDDFNGIISKELDLVQDELSSIKDISIYNMRCDYFKSNIYSHLLNNFLEKSHDYLNFRYQILNDSNILVDSKIESKDMKVHKVANLQNYKNSKFHFSDSSYFECIDTDSVLKLNISLQGISCHSDYLDFLFDNLRKLAQSKLKYDINFFSKIFDDKNETISVSSRNFDSNEQGKSLEYRNFNQKEKNVAILNNRNFTVKDSINMQSLHKDFILNKYKSHISTNIILTSKDELEKIICMLSLDGSILERINNLLFDEKYNSEIVKVCFKNNKFLQSSFGYATIHR